MALADDAIHSNCNIPFALEMFCKALIDISKSSEVVILAARIAPLTIWMVYSMVSKSMKVEIQVLTGVCASLWHSVKGCFQLRLTVLLCCVCGFMSMKGLCDSDPYDRAIVSCYQ